MNTVINKPIFKDALLDLLVKAEILKWN